MSKKTPKKGKYSTENPNSSTGFSPVTLTISPAITSPQKNLTGTARVIKDIVADLYNNIQRWNALHIKGCGIVKQVASLKADESNKFSLQIDEQLTELFNIVQKFQENIAIFSTIENQIDAVERLPNISNPVFFSLEVITISKLIKSICLAYKKEFQAKLSILENIGFSKTKKEAMFFAVYWTHQIHVSRNINFQLESLLVETGHRPII
ncbi:hypothetical protein GWI33_012030 [Rhynchophorus ferrugineus]|uniref:Cyclin-dependent kinase 2-interacting protein n=1 Tax=Rhynchophorus ferrugineus TaxID=354439 RepID=A0A834M7Z0_RHYFE|nr:hypothetical protein GWI33_012030 [Rhynchophorus ferrugineus]